MKNNISILLLYIIIFSSCFSSRSSFININNIDEFETKIENLVTKKSPPGISVIVVKNEKVVYSKAFGYADFPKNQKATPQTVYQWWSLTKPFTATAILQLQEKGLLHIDDPIKKHLPFFDVKSKKKTDEEITIKQLLNHSSGLGDIGMKILGWIHYEEDEPFDQTELVRKHLPKHKKLEASPGMEGRYSNLGFMLLAAIIEEVSNQSYDSYITQHILQPLEMNSTSFHYSNIIETNIASGSHPQDFMSLIAFTMIDKKKAVRENQECIYWFNPIYSNQQGSTGLIGSTENLSHFMLAMLNKGTWKGEQILSHESVKLMQTPQIDIKKSPAPNLIKPQFGLSWFMHDDNGRKAFSHGGAGAAFVAQIRLYPDQNLGIAIMANSTYLEKDMGGSIISELAKLKW